MTKLGVQMVEWTGRFAYKQVADDLRRRIAAGEFAKTGQLPSLAQLQEKYDVTVTVARAAINQLKADGLAVSHQGKGAFLTPNADRAAQLADPAELVTELRAEVEKLRSEVGDLRRRVATLEGD
ncbi:GntR family transcriptional regulator [Streptomyces sp. NPDC001406]|uniref:GntR family transcriptional regulator n=1 Tax=Streptomyces sp. NPDC001406 TaxID=3364572 RepID=UPI0036CC0ED2